MDPNEQEKFLHCLNSMRKVIDKIEKSFHNGDIYSCGHGMQQIMISSTRLEEFLALDALDRDDPVAARYWQRQAEEAERLADRLDM